MLKVTKISLQKETEDLGGLFSFTLMRHIVIGEYDYLSQDNAFYSTIVEIENAVLFIPQQLDFTMTEALRRTIP